MENKKTEIDLDELVKNIASGRHDDDMVHIEEAIRERRRAIFNTPKSVGFYFPSP